MTETATHRPTEEIKTMRVPLGSLEDLYEDFFQVANDNKWTDGLPVIPPTPKRVAEFLATLDRDPDEVMFIMPPRKGPCTLRAIAANAVMAGCLPEYFRIHPPFLQTRGYRHGH